MSPYDDGGINFFKKSRSECKFRRRIADRNEVTKETTDKIGETASVYLLHDGQSHRIPLPPDSSGESKIYDPDNFPEGTSLDIIKDKGDEDHIKRAKKEEGEEIGVQVSHTVAKK